MGELDLRAAKITYENIENDDVIEFRAWCLVYAEVLVAAIEELQKERLQEIAENERLRVVLAILDNPLRNCRKQLAETTLERDKNGLARAVAVELHEELQEQLFDLRKQLADLQLRYNNQRDDCIDYVKDIESFKTQLAEAQGFTSKWKMSFVDTDKAYNNIIVELKKRREQLAASQAEVERLEEDTSKLEDAIRKNAKPTGWLI